MITNRIGATASANPNEHCIRPMPLNATPIVAVRPKNNPLGLYRELFRLSPSCLKADHLRVPKRG